MPRPIVNRGGLIISRAHALRGLSLVGFVGGLAAIAGGLLSGVFYLGIDVKTATRELLLKSELIEPTSLSVTSDDSRSQSNENDFRQIGQSTDHNNTDNAPVSTESPTRIATQNPNKPEPIPTRQYWVKLIQATQQKPSARQPNRKGQLYEYLSYQQQRHQQAMDAITNLGQPLKVDERVLSYAAQALRWHHSGVDLYRQAAQHLTVTRASKWSGPFARSWQNAVTQHRMEKKLLLAKQQAVASYLGYSLRSHGPAR
jgi:hypothetical protein